MAILDNSLKGYSGLVHDTWIYNRGQTDHRRCTAPLVALDASRQLSDISRQLVFERIIRVHVPHLQTVLRGDDPVRIRNVLIFRVLGGNAEDARRDPVCAGTRDVVIPIREFHAQKIDRDRVDVGTVTINRNRSPCRNVLLRSSSSNRAAPRRKTAHGRSQSRSKISSLTIIWYRVQVGGSQAFIRYAIELPGALIATEEKQLVLLNRSAESTSKLVLP